MLELVIVEVGGPQRHHEVPEANHGALEVSKEADHHMAIEDGHGGLVAVHDAVLDGSGWGPVEHPRGVVLHLRLLEVQIQGNGGHGGETVPHQHRRAAGCRIIIRRRLIIFIINVLRVPGQIRHLRSISHGHRFLRRWLGLGLHVVVHLILLVLLVGGH